MADPEQSTDGGPAPRVVDRDTWLAERLELLAEEKALSRAADALAAKRRALPLVKLHADYRFELPEGEVDLAGLFAGRSQLVIYHFMFGPDWERPCPSCSFWADNFNGAWKHMGRRDVTMMAVSRAPLARLTDWAGRAGWTFPWASSLGSRFNFDFGVSFEEGQENPTFNYRPAPNTRGEMPGLSTFVKDDSGQVFHAYSTYARGLEPLNAAYGALDLAPRGRDEGGLPWTMAWVKRQVDVDEGIV